MTKKQCEAFIKDVKGKIYGNPDAPDGGIMSAELIADHMGISVSKANQFLWGCIKHGITERQGGGYVV